MSSEQEVCEFIQCICASAEETFPEPPIDKKKWMGNFATLHVQLDVSFIKRKPDFLVIDDSVDIEQFKGKDKDRLNWKLIKAFGQYRVTYRDISNADFIKLMTEMHNLAYCIFKSQDDRHYVPGITLFGNIVHLYVYDRGGLIITEGINIHKRPRTFIHLLLGLTYASDTCLGFDPNIITYDDGRRAINICNHKYVIIIIIYRSIMLQGQATTCYYVVYKGKAYVIKDYWVLLTRGQSEVDFIKIAWEAGVRSIAELQEWEDVKIDGRVDSCDAN